MGRVKQGMFDKEQNDDLIDFLNQLLEQDELNGAIEGIAKQVIDKGVESMSEKQKTAIDGFVENYKSKYECDICNNGNISSLSDYIFLSENDLCPMCENDRDKFMNED